MNVDGSTGAAIDASDARRCLQAAAERCAELIRSLDIAMSQSEWLPAYDELTSTTVRCRGPWTPSTRASSMSLVADGPLMNVSGRRGSDNARPSGIVPTTWSARTTHTWTSGTSVMARRPWSPDPSSTSVPVSAMASRAPGDDGVHGVQFERAQRTVIDDDLGADQRGVEARRDDDPPGAPEGRGDPIRHRARRGSDKAGPVVDGAVLQQVQEGWRTRWENARRFVFAGHRRGRAVAGQGQPDALEDLLTRCHHAEASGWDCAHHSRNVCLGGAGRSRLDVHAESGGGNRVMRPFRLMKRASRLNRCSRRHRPGRAMAHPAAAMAMASGVGSRYSALRVSTCWARRWTRTRGCRS